MILFIEAFYSGSHRRFIDTLIAGLRLTPDQYCLVTMSGKKWHWRARTSALHLANCIPRDQHFSTVFTTAVVPLAELLALRPDLTSSPPHPSSSASTATCSPATATNRSVHKVLYFHENQLVYPVRHFSTPSTAPTELSATAHNGSTSDAAASDKSAATVAASQQWMAGVAADKPLATSVGSSTASDDSVAITAAAVAASEDLVATTSTVAAASDELVTTPATTTTTTAASEDSLRAAASAVAPTDKLLSAVSSDDSTAGGVTCTEFQYGYNQILSCLVADTVLFNSAYNRNSFLNNVDRFLRRQPDYKPSGVAAQLAPKCHVLHYPLLLLPLPPLPSPLLPLSLLPSPLLPSPPSPLLHADTFAEQRAQRCDPLHIVWPHRWEHDKNPDDFFAALDQLHCAGLPFCVSVVGQTFSAAPIVFERSRRRLAEHVVFWGHQPDTAALARVLAAADVVVSTARHEFFGVAVLEAMAAGCWPLCPRRLVYPELLLPQQLYSTQRQLVKQLSRLCRRPQLARAAARQCREQALRFDWSQLEHDYRRHLRLDIP